MDHTDTEDNAHNLETLERMLIAENSRELELAQCDSKEAREILELRFSKERKEEAAKLAKQLPDIIKRPSSVPNLSTPDDSLISNVEITRNASQQCMSPKKKKRKKKTGKITPISTKDSPYNWRPKIERRVSKRISSKNGLSKSAQNTEDEEDYEDNMEIEHQRVTEEIAALNNAKKNVEEIPAEGHISQNDAMQEEDEEAAQVTQHADQVVMQEEASEEEEAAQVTQHADQVSEETSDEDEAAQVTQHADQVVMQEEASEEEEAAQVTQHADQVSEETSDEDEAAQVTQHADQVVMQEEASEEEEAAQVTQHDDQVVMQEEAPDQETQEKQEKLPKEETTQGQTHDEEQVVQIEEDPEDEGPVEAAAAPEEIDHDEMQEIQQEDTVEVVEQEEETTQEQVVQEDEGPAVVEASMKVLEQQEESKPPVELIDETVLIQHAVLETLESLVVQTLEEDTTSAGHSKLAAVLLMQRLVRGHVGRMRFQRKRYSEAAECGVLGAMPGTTQGITGWYQDASNFQAYYFNVTEEGGWQLRARLQCEKILLSHYDMKKYVYTRIEIF